MARTKTSKLVISSVVAAIGLLAVTCFGALERFEAWVRRSGVVALVRDFGGRKGTAEKLGEAESRYRTLVEQGPGIIYVREVAGSGRRSPAIYAGPRVEAQTGYPPRELPRRSGV
jgi:PAS domain-containing protein